MPHFLKNLCEFRIMFSNQHGWDTHIKNIILFSYCKLSASPLTQLKTALKMSVASCCRLNRVKIPVTPCEKRIEKIGKMQRSGISCRLTYGSTIGKSNHNTWIKQYSRCRCEIGHRSKASVKAAYQIYGVIKCWFFYGFICSLIENYLLILCRPQSDHSSSPRKDKTLSIQSSMCLLRFHRKLYLWQWFVDGNCPMKYHDMYI